MTSMFGNLLGNAGNGGAGAQNPGVMVQPGARLFPNRIFVGGMSRETTEEDLVALFSNYGQVRSAKIITDPEGSSKGYGFITFTTDEEAQRIQKAGLDVYLHGKKLNIGPAIKRVLPTPEPPKTEVVQDLSNFLPYLAAASSPDQLMQPAYFPYYSFNPFNFPAYGLYSPNGHPSFQPPF